MGRKVQVTFDCRDPDALARFYASALHFKLQDPPEGFSTWEEALKAWGVPEEDWSLSSAIVDPEGRGPRIYFQKMDTPKPGKNRLHIDVNASGGPKVPMPERRAQVRREVDRLVGIGAKKQAEREENGEFWIVMLDPEDNEFCVQ
jgi:hypothetical protein